MKEEHKYILIKYADSRETCIERYETLEQLKNAYINNNSYSKCIPVIEVMVELLAPKE